MKKYFLYFLGLNLIAFAVVLNVRFDLGVAAFSSVMYSISQIYNISLGTASIICYLIFVIIQCILSKKITVTFILEIPLSFAFGWLTDLYDFIIPTLSLSLYLRVICFIMTMFITAMGVFLSVKTNLILTPTDGIVKTISESSSSYYMYKLLCDDIEIDDKSLLIKSICNLDDTSYICDTIKLMGSNLSSDDIDNIVSSYSRTSNFLIVKSLIQNNANLPEENIDLIINCIFKEINKENIIYFTNNMQDSLTKKQIEKIIDLAVKTNDSELIYNVSKILKNRLDKENISKVSKNMSKQENIYYVYEFLCEFKDKLSKEDKNKLVSKIVNSKEMKLIILVAVFIDVKLIEKLFKSKKELFIFAVGLNAFTLEEIKNIKEKLDIKEEKPNMKNIPKKYKLKKKDK